MNNYKNILLLGLLTAALAARAQTNTPTVTATNQVPNLLTTPAPFTLTSLFSGTAGLQQTLKDAVNFIEHTTNNGLVTVESGALYATKTRTVGGFLDCYLPVGGTNSVLGAGFGLAYLDQNFYDATLNARLGDTFNVPFINLPVYAYVESGGGYNLSKNEVISQAFGGLLFKLPVTTAQTVTLGAAIGAISDEPGNIWALGGSYTWTF